MRAPCAAQASCGPASQRGGRLVAHAQQPVRRRAVLGLAPGFLGWGAGLARAEEPPQPSTSPAPPAGTAAEPAPAVAFPAAPPTAPDPQPGDPAVFSYPWASDLPPNLKPQEYYRVINLTRVQAWRQISTVGLRRGLAGARHAAICGVLQPPNDCMQRSSAPTPVHASSFASTARKGLVAEAKKGARGSTRPVHVMSAAGAVGALLLAATQPLFAAARPCTLPYTRTASIPHQCVDAVVC
jgi:hypothetical protein